MPSTAVKAPKRFVSPAASTSTPSPSDTGRVGGDADTLPKWPVRGYSPRPRGRVGTGRDVVDGATVADVLATAVDRYGRGFADVLDRLRLGQR